jgi:hypothetical protein
LRRLDERVAVGVGDEGDLDRALEGDPLRDAEEQAVEVERRVERHERVLVHARVLREVGVDGRPVGLGRVEQGADLHARREPV